MSSLSEAQQYIADSNAGKVQWNDNQRAAMNNIIDSYDPAKQAEKLRQQNLAAVQPAIDSYKAQIPEIQAKYGQARSQLQAQQPSLEQRYASLLDEIKGNQTADVNSQTRITSGELGKRGITGSSTLAQQEIQNAVQPINSQYTKMTADTSLAREDAIRQLQDSIANLTPQETADERAITNAIAQLQAGAGQTGIQQGLSLYSQNMQNDFQQQQLAQQQKQQDIQNAIAQMQAQRLQPVSIGQNSTAFVNPYTGQTVNTINGLRAATGGAVPGSNPIQTGTGRYSVVGAVG